MGTISGEKYDEQARHIQDAQEEARRPIAALSRSLSPSSSSDASSYSSFSSTSSEEEPIGGAIEKTGQFRTIAALRGEIDPIPREMEQQINHNCPELTPGSSMLIIQRHKEARNKIWSS